MHPSHPPAVSAPANATAASSYDYALDEGLQALAGGDLPAACQAFHKATAAATAARDNSTAPHKAAAARDNSTAPHKAAAAIPWLALARACNRAGDHDGEEDALQQRIKAERSDIRAIFAMAESKRRRDDKQAAVSFYTLALATAAHLSPIPSALAPTLDRARAYIADCREHFASHLTAQLAESGLDQQSASPRIATALRLLRGEEQIYLQQPSMFYFPGVSSCAWWEKSLFTWAAALEAETPAIRAELEALLGSAGAQQYFEPYVTASTNRPPPNNPLLDKEDWGAAWLWRGGAMMAAMAARCPRTIAALARLPLPQIPVREPIALFSRLQPNTHIAPHHGLLNTRLICHLPLIVPSGCGIRVGAETRHWQEGRLLIFDDSIEHEAWNRGTSDRIVLIFAIWRPDINIEERAALTKIFATIPTA